MDDKRITPQDVAEHFGHMLASDLLAYAQERNPGVRLRFETVEVTVLLVETDRGAIREQRRPRERWWETFRRLGLV